MHEPARRQPFSAKQAAAMLACSAFFLVQVFCVCGAVVENAGLQQELQAARLVEGAVFAKKKDGEATGGDLEKVAGIYALDASADFLWKIDRRSEAMAQWEKAETLAPENAEIANRLGGCHLALGNAKRATEYFERAATLDTKSALYHFNAGNTCFVFRREMMDENSDADAVMRRALDHFRQAAQLEPFNVEYARSFAETFYSFQKPDWESAVKAALFRNQRCKGFRACESCPRQFKTWP
jgi:tetratricopeptide (TPR) repeat protein